MTTNTSTQQHLAEVLASFDHAPDRTRQLVAAAVKHLFAFVEDVGLRREEWLAGIQLLTRIGQTCTDTRQEFILLSDVLGVSMLIEMLEQNAGDRGTEPTVLGPFYVPGAPERPFGSSIVETELGGEPLTVSGTVRSVKGAALPAARVEVWQTAANGLYDVQDPTQATMNLRGVFTTAEDGRFAFDTVRPVPYPIPADGPVGDVLAATRRANWRPAHIHLVVSADGHRPVSTHVFDAASPYLDDDAVFGVRPSLIVDMEGGAASFDVVLAPTSKL